MKERPILFSGPMVRALLAGTKTQTRRAVKGEIAERDGVPTLNGQPLVECPAVLGQCPYGAPGDRLWVRETWAPHDELAHRCGTEGRYYYRADDDRKYETDGRWHPSIHMPRRVSRITLEVTGIRVERLQSITPDDAKAEGIQSSPIPGRGDVYLVAPHRKYCHEDGKVIDAAEYAGPSTTRSPVRAYEALWDSINGTRDGFGWDANPWVWVIEFTRR